MIQVAVLFTGSRSACLDHLPHKQVIWGALHQFGESLRLLGDVEVTLYHGDADGADQIAKLSGEHLGWKVDANPADWRGECRDTCEPGHRRHYKRPAAMRIHTYCPAAGNYRNQEMVDKVVPFMPHAICFATPMPRSRGTWDCVRRARAAGIETVIDELPEKPRRLHAVN